MIVVSRWLLAAWRVSSEHIENFSLSSMFYVDVVPESTPHHDDEPPCPPSEGSETPPAHGPQPGAGLSVLERGQRAESREVPNSTRKSQQSS